MPWGCPILGLEWSPFSDIAWMGFLTKSSSSVSMISSKFEMNQGGIERTPCLLPWRSNSEASLLVGRFMRTSYSCGGQEHMSVSRKKGVTSISWWSCGFDRIGWATTSLFMRHCPIYIFFQRCGSILDGANISCFGWPQGRVPSKKAQEQEASIMVLTALGIMMIFGLGFEAHSLNSQPSPRPCRHLKAPAEDET